MRFLTAGESHGKALTAILEGFPQGFILDEKKINQALARRKQGYGRGDRMRIEPEKVQILSGLRNKKTTGGPIGILIENKDWRIFPFKKDREPPVTIPRPAHADLTGMLKYQTYDARDILERASARETAVRVVVGSICKQALEAFEIDIVGYVVQIGNVAARAIPVSVRTLQESLSGSRLLCPDRCAEQKMIRLIDTVREEKDTLGGIFEIRAGNVPAGLGSCMHWDRRLDAQFAYHLVSIPAVKAVEFGAGCAYAKARGSQMHDEIFHEARRRFYHRTNNSGGLEGGMTNGEDIVIRGHMKPIPTLLRPLRSVQARTKNAASAHYERSDIIALTSCAVVAEHVCSFVVLNAVIDTVGGVTKEDMLKSYRAYVKRIRQY